jgi:hypothetical protein
MFKNPSSTEEVEVIEKPENEKDLKSPKTPKTVTFLGEDMFFLVVEITTKWKEYKILDCFDILSGKTGETEKRINFRVC